VKKMEKTNTQKAYIDELVAAGKSVVVYENGDLILVDSPRLPRAGRERARGGRSCEVKSCLAGMSHAQDRTIQIDDGGSFHGHERQPDGSCLAKTYRCRDGTLA
jgi:hypothetical protein